MSDLVVDPHTGELRRFEPQAAKAHDVMANAAIDYARSMKDWPLLERAVDVKLEQQKEFVQWWADAIGRNHGGKRRGNQVPRSAHLNREQAEELTGITHQQVSKWNRRLADIPKYREQLYGAAYRKAMAESHNHRAQGTGENEWYTPSEYIEAARAFMGAIDLDPASSALANETVRAHRFFSAADDGLSKEWRGRVWLNPPYAQPAIGHFMAKLVAERENFSEAVALTHNYTDTAWFHLAAGAAAAICFTRGRIAFVNPDGERAAPTQGQAFFYFGKRPRDFVASFVPFGFVMVPHA